MDGSERHSNVIDLNEWRQTCVVVDLCGQLREAAKGLRPHRPAVELFRELLVAMEQRRGRDAE